MVIWVAHTEVVVTAYMGLLGAAVEVEVEGEVAVGLVEGLQFFWQQ